MPTDNAPPVAGRQSAIAAPGFKSTSYQHTLLAQHPATPHIVERAQPDNKHQYRPDVDGLRAVAILPVILFHADFGCPGGFVGVDIFFVISGFLITSLLLGELKSGSFSLINFWERRIRRILPPLFFVVLFKIGRAHV